VKSLNIDGGLGGISSAQTSLADLRLIRHAINDDWDMPSDKKAALMRLLGSVLRKDRRGRVALSVARCLIAAYQANERAAFRLDD
jgi:hypothetical protein